MPRKIVIGDIHGCFYTLKNMLFDLLKITRNDSVYLLGDYIDRGPRSKEVIDLILALIESKYKFFPIIGNHEQMLLDSLDSDDDAELWHQNGAASTLKSFNIRKPIELEPRYLKFFESLPYYIELEQFILVHGGLDFNLDNPFSDTYSMVWLRNNDFDPTKTKDKRLIVGHTPMPVSYVKNSLISNKIMLDSGCVYIGRHPELGFLTALDIGSMSLSFQPNIDVVY